MKNWFFNTFPGLEAIYSQTAYQEIRSLAFLYYLTKRIKPSFILELGTGRGCSTAFMALALGDNDKIMSIDNYQRTDINNPELVRNNIRGCGVLDKVVLIEGSTFDVNTTLCPEIVFMDASHTSVDLHKEYAALQSILPTENVIVIDDALGNDIYKFIRDLMKQGSYQIGIMLPFHQGMAVLITSNKYLLDIAHAANQCLLEH